MLTRRTFLFSIPWAAFCADDRPAIESAAGKWLTAVDQGKYRDSWDMAAKIFQSAMTAEAWELRIQEVRFPLGKISSRKLNNIRRTRTLPGAPDGDYAVAQYDSKFVKQEDAMETVVLAWEDAAWKVAGYLIR